MVFMPSFFDNVEERELYSRWLLLIRRKDGGYGNCEYQVHHGIPEGTPR